jgi:hypothetical protein
VQLCVLRLVSTAFRLRGDFLNRTAQPLAMVRKYHTAAHTRAAQHINAREHG